MNRRALLMSLVAAWAVFVVGGCGDAPRARTVSPAASVGGGGPTALRGTIGREAILRNADRVLVSGYGLVVGLNDTGATDVPAQVEATMEREIETMIGGIEGAFDHTVYRDLSARELLRHPTTAVVLVEGAVAPGGPEGMRFDVRVRTLSGSSATSLEGGRLWTTRLQIGRPVTLGGPQTEIIAEARGEVFINPFVTPGSDQVQGRIGRVLGGGLLTDPLPLELVLENPLHSRANSITRAVNQRFPDGPRGPRTTAYGRNDQIVQVFAPTAYQQRFDEFISLLLALPINQSAPELLARRYRQAIVDQPELAEELSWALRAIGASALPHVRDLYDFPEVAPRMAGLAVGAHLNDARAADFLEQIALEGESRERIVALERLGAVDGRASSDEVLRQVAGFGETLTERSMAYDSLMRRAERGRLAQLAAAERRKLAGVAPATETQLRLAAARRIPAGNAQGVERIDVGGRFAIDVLPFGEPMVFVTLQGSPRIAIFGRDAELERPLTVIAWDSRLMMRADDPAGEVLLRYEDARTERVVQQRVSHELVDLVMFLARGGSVSDFGPGLGFTYSEVVGALAAIRDNGATEAVFATEDDRLRGMLLIAEDQRVADRPALLNAAGTEIDLSDLDPVDADERPTPAEATSGWVQPIEREEEAAGDG